ncbi:MAG: hypothetical protein Terrestrivirus5_124 [Terrestrivirus sp.]|uniref:Uncharacterized protein n=1 Tax=Terrestrivirus sp. TaxID=2487775 RepID=A0A3G4ZN60_9VIRU|nr:MAG: hypothetical protein Terrestrivirus5_124 [Terrestrivirus sp.]
MIDIEDLDSIDIDVDDINDSYFNGTHENNIDTKINLNENDFFEQLNKNKKIFLHLNKLIDNNKYKEMIKFITNIHVIKQVEAVLITLNFEKLSKKLLSAYIIVGFPDDFFSINCSEFKFLMNMELSDYTSMINNFSDNDIEINLYVLSITIIRYITYFIDNKQCDNNLIDFIGSLHLYYHKFDQFIRIDKEKQINKLIKRWCDLEITKELIIISDKYTDEQKNDTITVMNQSQIEIKNLILHFDDKFDLTILFKYTEIQNRIQKYIMQTFWDNLFNSLDENYNEFYNVLNIIIEYINLLSYNIKYLDNAICTNYTNYTHIDHIKYRIKNHSFSTDDFINLFDVFVNVLIKIPDYNKVLLSKWIGLKQIMIEKTNTNNNKETQNMMIVNGLKFLLEHFVIQ